MSFFDTLKGMGKRQGDTELAADEATYGDGFSVMDDPRDLLDTVQDGGMAGGASASIISEASPSTMLRPAPAASAPPARSLQSRMRLPLIGGWPARRQQQLLGGLLALGVIGLVLASALAVQSAGDGAGQPGRGEVVRLESQRLSKAVLMTMVGAPGAATEVRDAAGALARDLRALRASEGAALDALLPWAERAEQQAAVLGQQAAALTQLMQGAAAVRRDAPAWLEASDAVLGLKLAADAPSTEVAAAAQAGQLLQRLLRVSLDAAGPQAGVAPVPAAALQQDLDALRATAQALLDGSSEPRLSAARDAPLRDHLATVLRAQQALQAALAPLLGQGPGLVAARQAQQGLLADGDALRAALDTLPVQGAPSDASARQGGFGLALVVGSLALGVLGGIGLLAVFTQAQRQRAVVADAQRHEAERQEREAKRVNDANQAAILRLMNELQSVAEGDLTQQATVTEDITGAIADSVNYTVEELRNLVAQVQGTAARVTDTTQQVEATSTELLAASDEQLREIRDTGEAVLQMAGRIQRVSGQAQQSADVAHESLTAAASGLSAVQDTISGMNTLREQIQETSKRIKRLGESSQEIGEITELISDITEQTNVLALNAAIQAASAGDAGRGFSVVAEEVQRLAERSADATRQIAALVKTIQTDTGDAVAAMERSTQGVVEGARLSDNAGTALTEIDRVARRLAELIEQIADQSRRESDSATVVAQNIQHIFAVTEQTGEGTRSTAQLVRQLSRTAEELRQSVARFKIG
jgi:twitching motility protein PilJ